ncbi:MAG: GNAT family N-acetyltransferase [Anaerovoracaceae bacterium]|jgi:predicted N-acetyltransferase YhbS|nr:GNAT family N-acetyltransferase [Anaerovoracaceae bacterium]
MYALLKTDDYKGLTEMFYDNGLEIDVCDEAPEEVIQAWEMIEIESGRRVGGMALEKRSGEYVLADLAVLEEFRGQKLGIQMVDKAIEELRLMGGEKVLLVAKIPDFYRKWNFKIMKREDAPNISKCMTCEKFNRECFPEVMYLDL